ncbi:MAG TPA: GntR family transcriptional regulator [Pseudonocardia sp.]|jgi:GntR family transcriptional regulator of gluconate operon|uniref:GntR family transcriptional regulator n=1 Tax=Pseudonocardia sp. TaxID=60912 RepID=UPI002B4AD731|nr:GntR family transcriptional regulator [Pseudonocardia sp.]HLU60206.1 GntR family transcriptional regulator [Pseudonocardia sp.]
MSVTANSSAWRASVDGIRPAPALGSHVLQQLRRLIIRGELQPGTHLVEAQLSETFDVSRGPVRDALRQLEVEGLVESRRRGVFVIGLTVQDIEELYSLRQLLEAEAVRTCMARPDRSSYASAREALERMEAAAEAGDSHAFAVADLAFHTSFYDACGHRRLASVWQQYRPTFADMLSVTNAEDRDLRPTYQDHVDLLAAIERGDEAAAVATLREHVDGSRRRMLTAYRRFTGAGGPPPATEDRRGSRQP